MNNKFCPVERKNTWELVQTDYLPNKLSAAFDVFSLSMNSKQNK